MKAISFLGTSKYQEATYIYQGQEFTTCLFPEALFHFFPDLETLYLFATPAVQKHDNLKELRDRLGNRGLLERFRVVPIPDGQSEDELWNIFSALTGSVGERETVVFDITHSFRSIPFLTFLAAAYLRAARRVHIRAVVYGAYEARSKDNPGLKPVFDLTPFVFLLDWLAATNQFIYTGDAQYLARLLVQEGEVRRSGALKNAGRELEDFSRAIMLCRPLEVMEKAGRVSNVLRKASADLARWARPFEVMAGRIEEEYGRRALRNPTDHGNIHESLRQQLDLICWYAEHGQIIQAVTLAREWVVTAVGWRLCGTFVLATAEREEIEKGLSGLCRVYHGRSSPDQLNEVGQKLREWKESEVVADLWNRLTAVRNDLDHAGMNPNPMNAATLNRKMREEILPSLKAMAEKWGLIGESRPAAITDGGNSVILLNFSHPLTDEQLAQVEALVGKSVSRVVEIPTKLDPGADFGPQIAALADSLGFTPQEWQTLPIIIVPPALNFAAVLLLAELHGRMGYFPPCVRLRPVEGAMPPRYEVAEILDLQGQRDRARARR